MSVEQLPVVAMSRLDDTTWSGTYDGSIVEGDYLATVNGTDGAGNFVMGTAVSFMSDQVALQYRITAPGGMFLAPVSPNPVRSSAVVRFGLPRGMEVRLAIYDSRGRRIQTLLARRMPRGTHRIAWNPAGESATLLAAGTYTVELFAEGRVLRHMVVVTR
jgi:hypothetical protein